MEGRQLYGKKIQVIDEFVPDRELALGKKIDGSAYTKKDEEALTKLADKIKLSLKFILAYEQIINNRYTDLLEEKDKIINKLLSYDGYSPAMRDLYPNNFLRAELLKAVKYPEISYRV